MSVHGLTNPSTGPGGAWVRYLSATSETPNSAPAAAAEEQSLSAIGKVAAGRDPDGTAPIAKIAASRAISAASEAQPRVGGAAAGESDDHQSGRGDSHAGPLSSPELEAEEALGEHREEDETAG